MVKVLVTGGAGFIGSHVVDKLLEKGHEVTILDNLSSGKKENVNPKAKLIVGDITKDLDTTLGNQEFDFIFHLAAQVSVKESIKHPMKDAEINILGTLNVLEYSLKNNVKKIIFSSSAAVYSNEAKLPVNEESELNPISPYGIAKLTIERYLETTKSTSDLDFVCLRYSNVYGRRQNPEGEAGVISIFINSILRNQKIGINGSGNQTRDFVFVEDIAESNIAAMNLSGIYNVSNNSETSIISLVEKIENILNKKAEKEFRPEPKGELKRSRLDNSRIVKEGWFPKVDFDSGLKKTIEYFKNKLNS